VSRSRTTSEAFLLAGVGGCVDAVGVITLGGLFVSHMSGNTAALGALFGQGHWAAGWPHLFAIPIFVIGLFGGYWWAGCGVSLRRCAAIFFLEAGLLAAFGVGMVVFDSPSPGQGLYFLLACLPLLAMGLQNATLRQIGRSEFPSTYVTGVLDRLAQNCAEYVRDRGTPQGREALVRAGAALSMWTSYAIGAVVGGTGLLVLDKAFLMLPVFLLLGLGFRLWKLDRPPVG